METHFSKRCIPLPDRLPDPLRRVIRLAPVLPILAVASLARADAIVRTQAMFASTIAEYVIEAGRVRVELEIGADDLAAFRNLLPDDVYAKLGNAPRPRAERIAAFFREDLVITTAQGEPLRGRLLAMAPRPRLRRDAISGEPLPAAVGGKAEGAEPETVVAARLEYALPGRPATLVLHGLRSRQPVGLGYVAYHGSVAVNDFRYLTPAQTLQLDWEDPWYTRFEDRSLRRQYFAPMSGFLYVEPYEVRKEIVVRARDLQRWVDLGLAGRETIPVEIQPELRRKAAAFLKEHQPVVIDGRSVPPELARVNFLERTLRSSRVIEPPEELDVLSAMLGVIFVYPIDGLPQRVTLDWDLWNEQIPLIPAAAVDQAGALPTLLEPDFRVLEWQNFLKAPELPALVAIRPPPGLPARALRAVRFVLLLVALGLGAACVRRARGGRGAPRHLAPATALALALTSASFWAGRDAAVSDARAREVVSGLLHNVYRAFDFRDEERIYDTLARSVAGDLLQQTFLETRRGLELASQGGARAKVKQIELLELDAHPADGGAFRAAARWDVAGSVGHWGHVHQRRNRYRAEIMVAPVEGAWKLTRLEILTEERL